MTDQSPTGTRARMEELKASIKKRRDAGGGWPADETELIVLLEAQLSSALAEIETLNCGVASLRAELAEAEAEIERLSAKSINAAAELSRLRAQLSEAKEALIASQPFVEAVYQDEFGEEAVVDQIAAALAKLEE